MPRKLAGSLIITSTATLALGCSLVGGSREKRTDPPVVVEVRNRNWQDMHVYVLGAGQRYSLGVVTSQSTQRYELPEGAFATGRDIVLLADPIGSDEVYRSDPVLLHPGDVVQRNLANPLIHSSLFIF